MVYTVGVTFGCEGEGEGVVYTVGVTCAGEGEGEGVIVLRVLLIVGYIITNPLPVLYPGILPGSILGDKLIFFILILFA